MHFKLNQKDAHEMKNGSSTKIALFLISKSLIGTEHIREIKRLPPNLTVDLKILQTASRLQTDNLLFFINYRKFLDYSTLS